MASTAAASTTPLARTTCACLLRAFRSGNPGGQPRSEEAQRQLMFFCNSLRFTSLKAPSPLAQVRSWTAFTPYYSEDVKYRVDQLTEPLEDEKTLFSLIVATFPNDYDNFKERVGALGADAVIDRKKADPLAASSAYDVIFDTPAVHSYGRCANALRAGGTYVTTLPGPALIAGMFRTLFSSRRCRFVQVAFDIANKGEADAILYEPAKLYDAAGSEYLDLDVQDDFLPDGAVTVTMTIPVTFSTIMFSFIIIITVIFIII